MNERPTVKTGADCSPVFSIAGVMPGGATMTWTTAYPDPDARLGRPRRRGHGPTFTLAGVVSGEALAPWRTAMPDPTRDALDAHGHLISRAEAAAAQLAHGPRRLSLAPGRHGHQPPKAA